MKRGTNMDNKLDKLDTLEKIEKQEIIYMNDHNKRMQEISSFIREGAFAYLKKQYSILAIFVIFMAIVLFAASGLFLKPYKRWLFGRRPLRGHLGNQTNQRQEERDHDKAHRGNRKNGSSGIRVGRAASDERNGRPRYCPQKRYWTPQPIVT